MQQNKLSVFTLRFVVIISLLMASIPEAEGASLKVPERRLTYTVKSLFVRGQGTVDYEYGALGQIAREIPYDNTHEAGRRQFRENTEQQVLRIEGEINLSFMPHYRMETYIEPQNWRTLRAVRWKKGFPDVLLDFLSSGEVLLTRAKPVSRYLLSRIDEQFHSSPADNKTEFKLRGPYDQIRTSGKLSDFMSVLFALEKEFTDDDGPPREPFYFSAVTKDVSKIYVARFEPMKQESITVEVNGESLQRPTMRCKVSVSYGHPIDLKEGQTITSLAEEYLPDKPRGEAVAIMQGIVGVKSLDDCKRQSLVVPVSTSLYSEIHDSDEDCKNPLGLSKSVTIWVDKELGIPLRAECRPYNFNFHVALSQVDEDYLNLLQGDR